MSTWQLGLNHLNTIASESKLELQMSTYEGEKKGMELGKALCHIECEYQGFDWGSKFDTCWMASGVTNFWQRLPQSGHTQTSTRMISMLLPPVSLSISTREHQYQVWSLPLSVRSDLPSGRRPALTVALSKERLSWKNTTGKSMNQHQWHSTNSCTSSGRNLDSNIKKTKATEL